MFEAFDGRGVVRRDVGFEDLRGAGRANAARAEHVLDGDGHAGEWRQSFAARDRCVDPIGLGVRTLGREREERVQLGIAAVNTGVKLSGELARGNLFRLERGAHAGNRP